MQLYDYNSTDQFSDYTLSFFYYNTFYKKIEAQICESFRIF